MTRLLGIQDCGDGFGPCRHDREGGRNHDRGRRPDDRAGRRHRRADSSAAPRPRSRRVNAAAGSTARSSSTSRTTSAIPSRRSRSPTVSLGQQIKFVDGHACSGSSIPASGVYAENNMLMMTPGLVQSAADRKGGQEQMADDHAPLPARRRAGRVHRALDRREIQGQEDRHPARQIGLRAGAGDAVKDRLNASGVNEVLFEGINPGEKDYTALVTKLKALGAEFVYFGGYHPEAGLILRQAADQGLKVHS